LLALSNHTPSFPVLDDFPELSTPALPVPERARPRNRLGLHIGLFILTLITATLAGADSYASFVSEFGRRTVTIDRSLLLGGLWYSGTFLAILGAHEAGHYLYCRYYGLDASLPYFIPLPPLLTITGTLGAVIRIREPFRTRTELFDVGIAGPVGGLIVLIPALFYGFTLSTVVPEPTSGTLTYFGEPLIFQWISQLVIGHVAAGSTINVHPVVWGCWFGLFATALNLLPFGQLDGGHIVYAVFGERIAKNVSAATALGLAAMIGLSITWIVPTVMLLAMWRWIGLRHPVPLNPYEPLSNGRRAFALVALIALIVCFTPTPIRIEDLVRT
jgi:membrane-associated protease RseP (regulator of RpoE activity)